MKRLILFIVSTAVTFSTIGGIFSGAFMIKKDNNIEEAKKVLTEIENRDLSKIEDTLEKERVNFEKQLNPEKDEEVNFFNFYGNTVFLGDSITEGLAELGVIDEYNVVSEKGDTVVKAMNQVDKVKQMNPKNIVLLYGMNDVIEFDDSSETRTPEYFKEKYVDLINELKKRLPRSNIYVTSPTSVMAKAQNINSRLTNENINSFREMTKMACEETKVKYVDISSFIDGKDMLHEQDGIHFKYDFYNIWLTYLKDIIEAG
ncbi:hypothetical protein UT300007_16660 [Clostridium sp. CTA-7]